MLLAYDDDIHIMGLSIKEVTNTFMNIEGQSAKGSLAVKSEKMLSYINR